MTICNQCRGYRPDIGEHDCPATRTGSYTFQPYISYPHPYPSVVRGQKCDICGSTAIDHTEMHCTLNVQLKRLQGKLVVTKKTKKSNTPSK